MKTKVAIVKAPPEQIHDAYTEALALAECHFPPSPESFDYVIPQILWRRYLPACGTTPWQLEGTILSLLAGNIPINPSRCYMANRMMPSFATAYKHSVILNRFGLPVESLEHGLAPYIAPNAEQQSTPASPANFYFLSTGVSHSTALLWGSLLGIVQNIDGRLGGISRGKIHRRWLLALSSL